MRVERGQHAGDGGFDQLLLVRLLDIVGADLLEDVAEQIKVAVGVGGRRARGAAGENLRLRADRHGGGADHGAEHYQGNLAHYPRTF
jgi:hypothetical protein